MAMIFDGVLLKKNVDKVQPKKKYDIVIQNNHKWYHYQKKNDVCISLEDVMESKQETDKYMVCYEEIHRLYTVFDNIDIFIKYLEKINKKYWHFYEVINGNQRQKIYFDIDIEVINKCVYDKITKDVISTEADIFCEGLLSNTVNQIEETLLGYGIMIDVSRDIIIFSSSDDKKKSFHIIVDNYYVQNNIDNRNIVNEILGDINNKYTQFIDNNVYSKNQQFRLYKSQKYRSSRVKRVIWEWNYFDELIRYDCGEIKEKDSKFYKIIKFNTIFKNSSISYVNNCRLIEVNDVSPKINNNLPNYSSIIIDKIILTELINRLPVELFQIYEINKIINNLILLKRKVVGYCNICARIHEYENGYLILSNNGIVTFSCRRNKDVYKKVADLTDILNQKIINNHAEKIVKLLHSNESQLDENNKSKPPKLTDSKQTELRKGIIKF